MRDRPAPALRARGLGPSIVALLLAVSLLPALAAATAPRIGLLTMAPGDEYWARFGHNAILVVEPDGSATSYNYGYFDFEQENFFLRFLQGRMLYQLVALPAGIDIDQYVRDGRGVVLQWLAIEPQPARELADFLAWNAQPENADYHYDYFVANCSTKVRDALDRALGGALLAQTRARSRGLTARSESLRLAATLPWMYLGIHFGLGPATDRPLSRWQEGFVPARLYEAIGQIRLADGSPLVLEEQRLSEHRLAAPDDEPPRHLPWFALTGLLAAVLLAVGLRRAPGRSRTIASAAAAAFWLLGGLLGCGLLALWLLTAHTAAWGNQNAWLLPPLLLLLLPALDPLRRDVPVPRWLGVLGLLALASALVGLTHSTLARNGQQNGEWLALLLPLQAVLAERLWQAGRHRDG